MSLKTAVIKKAPHVFCETLFLYFRAAITAFQSFQSLRGRIHPDAQPPQTLIPADAS